MRERPKSLKFVRAFIWMRIALISSGFSEMQLVRNRSKLKSLSLRPDKAARPATASESRASHANY